MRLFICNPIALLCLYFAHIGSSHSDGVFKDVRPNLPGSRIIGGDLAPDHAAPFIVGLESQLIDDPRKVKLCAGIIITNQHILTAGHCVKETNNNTIIMGTNRRLNLNEPQTKLMFNGKYIIHRDYYEDYNNVSTRNDIAIIKLPSPITSFDQFINKTSIPETKQPLNRYDGAVGRIYGWGFTHDPPPKPKVVNELRYVDVKVVPNRKCFSAGYWDINNGNICTSGRSPADSHKVGHCRADSGGPLMIDNIAVGIVSYSAKYCAQGHPSVYTRIDQYLDWIQDAIQKLQ